MNLLKLVPWYWRAAAVASLAAACISFGWVQGSEHVQDKWDAEHAQTAVAVQAQQQGVIQQLIDQAARLKKAGATNVQLEVDYGNLSARYAASVRALEAARSARPMCSAVADPGGQPGRPEGGSGGARPDDMERAAREQRVIDAGLACERELKAIWAAEPPPQ